MRDELGEQHRLRILAETRSVSFSGFSKESVVQTFYKQIVVFLFFIAVRYPSPHHIGPVLMLEPFLSLSSDLCLLMPRTDDGNYSRISIKLRRFSCGSLSVLFLSRCLHDELNGQIIVLFFLVHPLISSVT